MKSDIRKFTSLILAYSFLFVAFSGLVLLFTPPGRIANWYGWSFLGLSKGQWEAFHVFWGVVMIVFIPIHLYFNLSPFKAYAKSKTFWVATGLSLVLIIPAYLDWPPYSWIDKATEKVKDWYDSRYGTSKGGYKGGRSFFQQKSGVIQPRVHMELEKLRDLAERDLKAEFYEVKRYLEDKYGIQVRGRDRLIDISEKTGASPAQIWEELVKKFLKK